MYMYTSAVNNTTLLKDELARLMYTYKHSYNLETSWNVHTHTHTHKQTTGYKCQSIKSYEMPQYI